ncbi:MAG: hypothetical protein H6574_12910 [Lewinellaceae bacterium]|nr:hypothetical protein [Lewinellaceae bacterium]
MKTGLLIIFGFMPVLVSGQLLAFKDLLVTTEGHADIGSTSKVHLEKDIDGLGLIDFIEISYLFPYPEVQIYLSNATGSSLLFQTDGFIAKIEDDSSFFKMVIVRPPCCCLKTKKLTVFVFAKSKNEGVLETYQVHQDILLPLPDVVFPGPEKAGGDSLVLFKAPSNSDALEVDECTGEIGQRNLIGSYHTELKIPLIQEDEWELSLTCVKKGKTGKLNTSEWVLGWHKVTN